MMLGAGDLIHDGKELVSACLFAEQEIEFRLTKDGGREFTLLGRS